jgi:hypothetical protein
LYDVNNPSHVWKFSGITFEFPTGTILSPGEYILVVPTDPAVFRAAHPEVSAGTRVFGPYTGALDNAGEKIRILEPSDPETDGSYVYYTVDELKYQNASPWPTTTGTPIAKTSLGSFSNDPINWAKEFVSTGTPGKANFTSNPVSSASSWAMTVAGPYVKLSSGGVAIWNGMADALTSMHLPANATSFTLTTNGVSNNIVVSAAGLTINGGTLAMSNLSSLIVHASEGENTLSVTGDTLSLMTDGEFALNLSENSRVTLFDNQIFTSVSIKDTSTLNSGFYSIIVNDRVETPLQTLRQWIRNGITGATPAILTNASTLALVDNLTVHMTDWNGPLDGSFSQILILPMLPGDVNFDGMVDREDQMIIYANLGLKNATWLSGDLNNDGVVNLEDLAQTQATLAMSSKLSVTTKSATTRTTKAVETRSARHKTIKKVVKKPGSNKK